MFDLVNLNEGVVCLKDSLNGPVRNESYICNGEENIIWAPCKI